MLSFAQYNQNMLQNQYTDFLTKLQSRRLSNIQQANRQEHNMIEQQRQPAAQPQEAPAPSQAPLSTELFLFQQTVIDILSICKRGIKGGPFDDMNIKALVDSNFTQCIDIYQQYFLAGIGTPKTSPEVCKKYEHLISQNLINKDYLPPQMITGIINARPVAVSGGGSTASSGGNSAVGSALNLSTEKPLHVGKLVSAVMIYTLQSSSEISAGLMFLLEGTRNKTNGNSFVQLMENVYTSLNKYRKKPLDRFLTHFLNNIINEVQYHEAPFFDYEKRYLSRNSAQPKPEKQYQKLPMIMKPESSPSAAQLPDPPRMHDFVKPTHLINTKEGMCKHPGQEALYGKCFICEKDASHYDKTMFVPLCGTECKNRLKLINEEVKMNDHFNFLRWLLDTLQAGSASDEILFSFLLREVSEIEKLNQSEIGTILQIIVTNFSLQSIGITIGIQAINNSAPAANKITQNCALITAQLIKKYTLLMTSPYRGKANEYLLKQTKLRPNLYHTKVMLCEMVRMLQSLPVMNNSLQLTLLKSLIDILAVRIPASNSLPPLSVVRQLYLNCDCRVLEPNLVERIFNIISQYALNSNTSVPTTAQSSSSLTSTASLSSINLDSNGMGMGVMNGTGITGNSCCETAIGGLEEIMNAIVAVINEFNIETGRQGQGQAPTKDFVLEKKVKRYMERNFIDEFNKKPLKAIDKLRKMFDGQISPKDIATFIRQHMEYEMKIKRAGEKFNKLEVGTYFGTKKLKQKDQEQEKLIQKIYWEFLNLLLPEYEARQLDDCLRITFNWFRLPKEGQQVEAVLSPLSLMLQPILGFKEGEQATATYQLIMLAMMVQTSKDPKVKQGEKLKFDGYKKFFKDIDPNIPQARVIQIYERIQKRPLEIMMEYKGVEVFTRKYLLPEQTETDFWKHIKDTSLLDDRAQTEPSINQSKASLDTSGANTSFAKNEIEKQEKVLREGQQKNEQKAEQKSSYVIESKSSLQMQSSMVYETPQKRPQSLLSLFLLNNWEYIYMTFVNKNNLRGLEQSCILYGRCELITEFEAFFKNLNKISQELQERSSSTLQAIGSQARLIMLKLAIEHSNEVVGRQSWLVIIKIIYRLDYEEQESAKPAKKVESSYSYYSYEASDKLFTRTNTFRPERLREFLEAMCEFSSSEVRSDKNYTREMYILHHIAEIIQYNLERFEDPSEGLWDVVWPTIRNYFRNICVHPRRQIAMSAIDSYKQLTMKLLKLAPCSHISHNQLMNIYLYVFERSPAYIKDLIINILLNVVSRDMRSGWDQIYTILEIADSDDKAVVMKVVSRLVRDVGFDNIGNIVRLHQILIKELRISAQDGYPEIIERLWECSDYFGRLDIWLETLAKAKDIYKSTTSLVILSFLYRICNRCLEIATEREIQRLQGPESPIKSLKSRQMEALESKYTSIEKIQEQISSSYMQEALEEECEPKQISINELKPQQLHRLIYFEIFSVQMHILEIKSAALFADSINIFKQLSLDVFFRNVGSSEQNRTGFISLWQMFLGAVHAIPFNYFLHDYLGIVFEELARVQRLMAVSNRDQIRLSREMCSIRSLDQVHHIKRQLLLWLVKVYMESSKDEILQLCDEDNDLNKNFRQILQEDRAIPNKAELIEFYLSSKQYEAQCIQHLVFLKIFKTYYETQSTLEASNERSLEDIDSRILETIIEAYEIASEINSKPLLRNFLWNNEFFKGHDYLPGLMKQEIRALEIIIKYFGFGARDGEVYQLITEFLAGYTQKTELLSLQNPRNKKRKPALAIQPQEEPSEETKKVTQILYQDLGLYITNAEQIVLLCLKKLAAELRRDQPGKVMNLEELFSRCVELSRWTSSQKITRECALVLEELIARLL